MNFIAGLFPAIVASLSFVNYGGKFRLEWMPTSERAECFCFPDVRSGEDGWRVDTYEAAAAETHETHKPPGLMVIPGTN